MTTPPAHGLTRAQQLELQRNAAIKDYDALREVLRHQIFRNHGWNNGCAMCEKALTFFAEVPMKDKT